MYVLANVVLMFLQCCLASLVNPISIINHGVHANMSENSRLTAPVKRAESPCLFLLKPNNHTKPPMELVGFTPTIVAVEGRFQGAMFAL